MQCTAICIFIKTSWCASQHDDPPFSTALPSPVGNYLSCAETDKTHKKTSDSHCLAEYFCCKPPLDMLLDFLKWILLLTAFKIGVRAQVELRQSQSVQSGVIG